MEHQILTLAIRNNFEIELVWYYLKREVYPPLLNEFCKKIGNRTYVKKQLEARMEMLTRLDYYEMKWFCLCDETAKPVGFWAVSFKRGENNGKCYLEHLLVDESERGKGYGTKLMENFLDWTETENRPTIKVSFKNTGALRKFYSRFGFAFNQELSGDDVDDLNEIDEMGMTIWYKM